VGGNKGVFRNLYKLIGGKIKSRSNGGVEDKKRSVWLKHHKRRMVMDGKE
jgi:hypothetical protein